MMPRTASPLSAPLTRTTRSTARRGLLLLTGLSLTLATLSPSLAAQRPRAPRSLVERAAQSPTPVLPTIEIDEAKDTLNVSMEAETGMPLLDFIKWAQKVTGKRFTYNAQELRSGRSPGNNVHFIGKLAMKRDTFQKDFYSFFQTMLYIKGYAVVPRGEGDLELLEIVMMSGTRGREVSNSARYVRPDDLAEYQHQSGVQILTTVPLQHINAQLANNALRPFFASTGGTNPAGSVQIGNVGNKSSLLLQGFGPQVYAAAQLLKLVDTPAVQQQQPKVAKTTKKGAASNKGSAHMLKLLENGSKPAKAKATVGQDHEADKDTIAVSMNKPGGMELTEFIKWAQELTGKRFTYNPQELGAGSRGGATVDFLGTFHFPRKTFKQDVFALFQTMLYIKGFAIVPRGEGRLELLEIVMMTGTRGREVANGARYVSSDEIDDYRNQTGVPILTTVSLQHIDAQRANNALRPFFASTGGSHSGGSIQIGNVGNKSALLLQGFGPQVYAAVQLLKLVDAPSAAPTVAQATAPTPAKAGTSKLLMQVVKLEHKDPENMMQAVNLLFDGRKQPKGRAPLRVLADTDQKALILSGQKEQIREALDMIARLDVPSAPINGSANVVYLKHVNAEELAATLKVFMNDDFASTAVRNRGDKRTRRTVITAHRASNSLLISAAGSQWKMLQALIDKLDVAPRKAPKVSKAKANGATGFGFTSFGQATIQDTDKDGLPDTRLPNLERPVLTAPATPKSRGTKPRGQKVQSPKAPVKKTAK